MTTTTTELEWTDPRLLSELAFGSAFFSEADRPGVKERAIALLNACDVGNAEGVAKLGCTGLAAHKLSLDDIIFLREALGGTGVGLTCWVPPSLYCKVHRTVGGLQERQAARFVEAIPAISRQLTEDERDRHGAIEHVRRMEPADAADLLTNLKKKREDGEEEEVRAAETELARLPDAHLCLDHGTADFRWDCRYCVAEALVKGPLDIKAILAWDDGENFDQLDPGEIDARVAELDRNGAEAVALYVRVARWSRRLARE